MSSYKILDHTDQWLTRPKFSAPREPHLYPSEASVVITDDDGSTYVEGTCMRAAYLRYTGASGAPHNARTELIFAQGNMIEQYLIGLWKEMGIWVGDAVEFYWPEYNISGKLDAIIREPTEEGKLVGLECKSFYGYDAHKNIMGNKSTPGFPKMNQLLQTLVYTYYFRGHLDHFKMIYFARDDVKRREFTVSERETSPGTWHPVIDGKIYNKFTINDVLDRYAKLNEYIKNKEVPPNDYELVWDSARVEKEKAKGNVSKTAYEEYKKGKRTIGDWQCSYCAYKSYCWDATDSSGEEDLVQIGT